MSEAQTNATPIVLDPMRVAFAPDATVLQLGRTHFIGIGGRAGEAAGAVVRRGIRGQCTGQILPVQQVGTDGVTPVHGRPPHIVGVILIELVILPFIIREAVGVVEPAHIRSHVVGRAFFRGDRCAVLGLVGTGFL